MPDQVCKHCGKEFYSSHRHPFCSPKCGKLEELKASIDPEVMKLYEKVCRIRHRARLRAETGLKRGE